MKSVNEISKIFAGNKIVVPNYQRAYSWDTPKEGSYRKTHTDVFLSDLEEYNKSKTESPYYFGHFLFEDRGKDEFHVIDGQERLTTIVIFLSALFSRLKAIRELSEEEEVRFENIIKRKSTIHFETVDYDNTWFKDYVIEQSKKNTNGVDTVSAFRFIDAFEYFKKHLESKNEEYLTKMLDTIYNASCTTHPVTDEAEAIQMFIFQNNRGKTPSNLEVIKAQFMYNVHLYGESEKGNIIKDIKERFENIYKSISSIENSIDEDDVLVYTLRVYFNSLWEGNAIEKINKKLGESDPVAFIKEFTYALSENFENLKTFFTKHERENINIHSLTVLKGYAVAIPFVLKAYKFGLGVEQIGNLCKSLESLVLRHRIVGTRAELVTRINESYQKFSFDNNSIEPIIEKLEALKTTKDWWWAYWNNDALRNALQGGLNHSIAKYLLWKYENHLEEQGKPGYKPKRFDDIKSPELEHIAPTTEPSQRPHGYGEYTDEFKNQYLNCLGNYLLLSKSHNCSVQNIPFAEKLKTYNHLAQQRNLLSFVPENGVWGIEAIQKRKEEIIEFIIGEL